MATPQAFARKQRLVSQWYDERRCRAAECRPNRGDSALAVLQQIALKRGTEFTLVTQNVDGLHQAAGPKDVIELHGTLWVWRCMDCGRETEKRGLAFASYSLQCDCGGLRAPGAVWFGELLSADAMSQAQQATAACDLFISIGTSNVIYSAAGLIEQAIRSGAKVIEVNPQATPFSNTVHSSIRGNSDEVLPRLVDAAFAYGKE